MSKPLAVLISDVHFSVPTLELASKSLRMAKEKAVELGVPLVIAGDLTDSKAIIRGEVANRLIEIFTSTPSPVDTIVAVGNHDKINEKGREHSLNFLRPYCRVIEAPTQFDNYGFWVLPYFSDAEELRAALNDIPKGSMIIMHQGIQGADMGHYIQDKTSLPAEAFADFRVISGHYHKAQDIKTGRPRKGAVGLFSYIGNPYSLSFGEANDGPKGFQVLFNNGLMEQVPTNLRKHWIIDAEVTSLDSTLYRFDPFNGPKADDFIWVKMRGPYLALQKIKKSELAKVFGHTNFKLDKICTDTPNLKIKTEKLSDAEIFDAVIDGTDESAEAKVELKALWREVVG